MPSSTDSWGIEVGANAIKAIRLQRSGQDVSVAEYDVVPFKKVLTTPDIDVDETVRLGLDQFLSRHSIGRATVVISVPGHMAFARFAKLPPVEPKRIPDIVKFEAMQQIPFPIDQVEWDYQTFQHADSPDVEVGIFAITKERVLTWLSNFHAVGMPVHALTLSPLAVYNAMSYDLELGEGPGTILMDIGTSATDLVIVEGGRIWLRTIPIGGHHFTEALVRSFKLSYSKAEKIKKEAATSKYARQIFQAMRPVFVDLVGEVQKSLGFYQSLNRDANLGRLIGMGSTFRLPGLQKFLKQQLQMDVSRLENFKRIEPEGAQTEFAEQSVSLATAYGLALQGLEKEKVGCNILPAALIRKQVWKGKQPFNVAASLLIAASAVLAYSRLWWDQNAFAAQAPVRTQIDQIINEANQATAKLKEVHGTDPRLKIENLRRILDYRNVWPSILTDVELAVNSVDTQPDLASGDVDKIKKIKRSDRRQIFIDSLTQEYKYQGAADSAKIWTERPSMLIPSGPGGSGYGGTAQTSYTSGNGTVAPGYGGPNNPPGQRPLGPSPSQMPLNGPPATPGGAPAVPGSPAAAVAEPPSFLITLTGTTPHGKDHKAAKFLNDTIIKWLKANAQRPDRPYRLTDIKLVKVSNISDGASSPTPGTIGPRPPGAFPGGPTSAPGFNPTGFGPPPIPLPGGRSLPGAAPLPGSGTPLPGGATRGGLPVRSGLPTQVTPPAPGEVVDPAKAEAAKTIDDYFPADPLATEPTDDDYRFIIQWRVELIPPQDARKTELGAAGAEKPAADDAAAKTDDKTDSAKPDAAKPDTAKPDTAKPDAAKPDAAPAKPVSPQTQAKPDAAPAKAPAKPEVSQ